MIILQMMKPAKGVYHDVAKEYTSLRKMALMMKPKLNVNGEEYIFIGTYKGFLYSLSDGNLLKYIVTTKDGVITKDVNISIQFFALYNNLINVWLTKEGIKNILNGTTKYKKESIPKHIERLEIYFGRLDKYIHTPNSDEYKYKSVLKEYEGICYTKPRKRKKLQNLDQIKGILYEPLNFLLEKEIFTLKESNQFANIVHDEKTDFLNFNSEWKNSLEEYWIHY